MKGKYLTPKVNPLYFSPLEFTQSTLDTLYILLYADNKELNSFDKSKFIQNWDIAIWKN